MFSTFGSLIFIVAIIIILLSILKGLSEWSHNNKQPILSVSAKVATKRTETRHHYHQDNHHQHSTSYYATFEVESGDRIEFSLSGREYGQLAEGDDGKLIFQGTRFHRFERH